MAHSLNPSPSRLRRAVKVAAVAADVLRPRGRGIVTLIYHRVGRRSSMEVDLPTAVFDEQMAAVADRAITLDAALDALQGPAPARADPVVVTFDDGTADIVDVALPVLARHRVPALLYLATDFVERHRPFPLGGEPVSWAALADAVSSGWITIGSHTDTHLVLDHADAATAVGELDRSIKLIEDRLGVTPVHFAYPKAVAPSAAAEAAVRARFRSAALAGTRPNRYGRTDPFRLARTPVQVSDGMRYFHRKLAGGMRTEDDIRRALMRLRPAPAAPSSMP